MEKITANVRRLTVTTQESDSRNLERLYPTRSYLWVFYRQAAPNFAYSFIKFEKKIPAYSLTSAYLFIRELRVVCLGLYGAGFHGGWAGFSQLYPNTIGI